MQIEQKQNRIYKPQSNTTLSAEETNQVTTELENVIAAGGLTPNAGVLTQVRDAIQNVVDTSANNLQQQIDAITAASDVFDVVGTYAELQAYDKSSVPLNDIIKVLQDSTHNNAATYYRLVEESGGTTDWSYIGQEGPYYTKSEVDADFATKAELPGIATNAQVGLIKPDGTTTQVAADGTLTFTQSVLAALPLFTHHFLDHLLDDTSYLRADNFSWHSGEIYTAAYQHLVDDISGITAETETIGSTTITFYRATDGHKVVLANQESNVAAIYTAAGVAWYYILDTVNTRFKLPRSQWAFVGLRGNVGDYVGAGLPNISGDIGYIMEPSGVSATGAFYTKGGVGTLSGGSGFDAYVVAMNASRSSTVYGNSTTVQQKATQMYLYFYAGNTVINQTTIDVGQITEDLNNKADVDLGNITNAGKIVSAKQSMPSGTYDTLTIPASGSTVTAPSDGYFWLGGVNDNVSAITRVVMRRTSDRFGVSFGSHNVSLTGGWTGGVLPVKKGDTVGLYYVNITADISLRFYYAVGTTSEQ